MAESRIVYSEAGKNGGAPVFLDTDVPVLNLPQYLESGNTTLNDFLDRYQNVKREHAVAFLMEATTDTLDVDLVKKYETVVTSGLATLRALMTLNGGATIAFLTFIGHLSEKGALPPASTDAFAAALQFFVYGTFFAVLGYGTIFLTNTSSYAETKRRWKLRPSNVLFILPILCGIAALICFYFASRHAVIGFGSVSGGSPR